MQWNFHIHSSCCACSGRNSADLAILHRQKLHGHTKFNVYFIQRQNFRHCSFVHW